EFKGIGIPSIADLEPHRADLEAGWTHMLEHQLPALLPVATFWDALPEIFAWLQGAIPQPLAAMPIGAGATLIRERIIGLPVGSRGQNHIEMIRFAAANRLLVEIDYRDKQGNRSTRAIEAYSLRRSQAGEVLLMAVRADNGQSRSYLVDSILGVTTTQTPFSPRYPIELTPSGPQTIPQTASSGSGGVFGLSRSPTIRRSPVRRSTRSTSLGSASGPTYVFKCSVCGKTFNKKSYDATLNKHKNSRTGYECYGTFGTYVRTKY
ncbi:MAG: WYL domain-containing protein, partial [Alphaproteobacteria bacterium]|nr:WYL domain-containing protein [Alphaproteobacteria bacterium]